jgi:capsular polysaccharide biosynthesis protein
VQQLFLSKKSDSQSNRKIYIKRITNRKIANEKEFEALMQQQ